MARQMAKEDDSISNSIVGLGRPAYIMTQRTIPVQKRRGRVLRKPASLVNSFYPSYISQ